MFPRLFYSSLVKEITIRIFFHKHFTGKYFLYIQIVFFSLMVLCYAGVQHIWVKTNCAWLYKLRFVGKTTDQVLKSDVPKLWSVSSSPRTVRPSAAPVSSLNMWWAWSSAFWQNSVFLNNLALIVNKTEELTVGFRVNREEHARFYINWAPVEQVSEFKSPSFLRSLHSSSIQSILLYHQVWKLHCRGMQRSSEILLIYLFALLPDICTFIFEFYTYLKYGILFCGAL